MRECRIVEITKVNGNKKYQIERRHWLFRWIWEYMSFRTNVKLGSGRYLYKGEYESLKEAKDHLCYFDGTKCKKEVVYTNGEQK